MSEECDYLTDEQGVAITETRELTLCKTHRQPLQSCFYEALRSENQKLREALEACAESLLWLQGDRNLKEWIDERGMKQDPCGIRSLYQRIRAALEKVR